MTFIWNIEELAGKTITRAVFDGCQETLIIILATGEVFALKADQQYDQSPDLEVVNKLDEYTQLAAGLITEEEYADFRTASAEAQAEANRLRELQTLARLQAKYKGA